MGGGGVGGATLAQLPSRAALEEAILLVHKLGVLSWWLSVTLLSSFTHCPLPLPPFMSL